MMRLQTDAKTSSEVPQKGGKGNGRATILLSSEWYNEPLHCRSGWLFKWFPEYDVAKS